MPDQPFARLMRLIWIDAKLVIAHRINRSDICDAFGVSTAQAAADLRAFQSQHPGRVVYDTRAKTYLRAGASVPVYPTEARYAAHRAASAVREIMRRMDQPHA